MARTFTPIASPQARKQLDSLLTNVDMPSHYQFSMIELGKLLATEIVDELIQVNGTDNCNCDRKSKNSAENNNTATDDNASVLLVSSAEDADYLQTGVSDTLDKYGIKTKLAVFWNHHYQMSNNTSVAPILHQFIEPHYEHVRDIVIVKSIMSGSCVVRTNIIELLDKVDTINTIYILSPVAHVKSEEKLKAAFPKNISDKFKFICFALDDKKTETGEVLPGIGGQIYDLLGLEQQPALSGYIPDVVKALSFKSMTRVERS